jgi:hypothetical protein
MNLYAALWYTSGFREHGEVARWFYDDGTLIHVFEDRVDVKRCNVGVLKDLVNAHVHNGWSQFPTYGT